jgi:DNA (cytosine-5)-methyltransferase 1
MKKAISLFSSSGIGDLGLRSNGIETVVACELLPERMKLFQANYPATKCFCGDIWELSDKIVDYYLKKYESNPFLVFATPPCQGMSSNGMGKMLSDFRKGLRPEMDERNRLIVPTMSIIKKLSPEWVVLENVSNMLNTMIVDETDNLVNIVSYIERELGAEYIGKATVIDCANYGVPQHRKRLLSIFSRTEKGKLFFKQNGTFLPNETHAETASLFARKWVTVRDVLEDLPDISASHGKNTNEDYHSFHRVPILDEKKLIWVENTPEGDTAFNNQCINPACGFQGNPIHGARKDENGINRYNGDTPIYCEKCGALLPRPYVVDKKTGEKRLMKGYTSAYKRMSWDEPASTLTQNFQFACSDNKLHPSQNRVLSLYEGMVLQTISDYPYSFSIGGKVVNDGLIRDTIGESKPPRIIDLLCKNILQIEDEDFVKYEAIA